jgi:hypothetical protein
MVTMRQAHLAPSSLGSYVDKFARWVHYCTETCNPAVPYLSSSASPGDAQVSWKHVLRLETLFSAAGPSHPAASFFSILFLLEKHASLLVFRVFSFYKKNAS